MIWKLPYGGIPGARELEGKQLLIRALHLFGV
jgi:hypothetical protein